MKTGGPLIEGFKVYYFLSLKIFIKLLQTSLQIFVSVLLMNCLILNLVHSLLKLRLPEDHLIKKLVERCEELLFKMNAKDLALIVWSQARLKMDYNNPFVKKSL